MMGSGLDRRALLQRAFALAGAAMLPGGAEALATAVKAGKRQLDPARYALLTALADTIVPKTDSVGALDAGVPANVDALLGTWASPSRRVQLIAAMDKIDALARTKHKRAFAALSPAERAAVLTPHDAAALKILPPPPPPTPTTIPVGSVQTTLDPQVGRAKQDAAQPLSLMEGPRVVDPGYGKLKELIVVLFYISEVALTHDLSYVHAPGEWQPSIPLTPSTRPAGGAGLF